MTVFEYSREGWRVSFVIESLPAISPPCLRGEAGLSAARFEEREEKEERDKGKKELTSSDTREVV